MSLGDSSPHARADRFPCRSTNVANAIKAVGASFSSPYAAGAAALLLEADPLLTPDGVKALLQSHGPLVMKPDNGLSFPRIDVGAAVDEALEL